MTSPKLDTLLIHVLDMFRGEVGVCVVNILQKLIEMGNICWIKILSMFWIQIPRLGCADLRMVLLKPVDPV